MSDNELMHQIKMVHIGFVDAAETACQALAELLNEIDLEGTADDSYIEREYGRLGLEAYQKAEAAYRDLECFF